eukprot:2847166-Pyramimonas_sp.AAC.1
MPRLWNQARQGAHRLEEDPHVHVIQHTVATPACPRRKVLGLQRPAHLPRHVTQVQVGEHQKTGPCHLPA